MDAKGRQAVWLVWVLDQTSNLNLHAITTTQDQAMTYRKGALEPLYGVPAVRAYIEKAWLDHLYGGDMLSSYLKMKRVNT